MRDRWKDCSDEELIIRLREGEQEVMDYLMDKYKNLVRDKAKSMYILGGDTEGCRLFNICHALYFQTDVYGCAGIRAKKTYAP